MGRGGKKRSQKSASGRVLQPALTHALKLLADQKTATDHVHT